MGPQRKPLQLPAAALPGSRDMVQAGLAGSEVMQARRPLMSRWKVQASYEKLAASHLAYLYLGG